MNRADRTDSQKELSNRLFNRFSELMSAGEIWTHTMYDPDLDNQRILRDNAFTFLIYSLCEVCENYSERMKYIERLPHYGEHQSASHYVGLMRRYITLMAEMLCIFTPAEFIFLIQCRHSTLHGQAKSMFDKNLRTFRAEGHKIVRRKVPHAEYWELYRSVLNDFNSLHEALTNLRDRYCSFSTPFWSLDSHFRANRHIIGEDFHSFEPPRALLNTPDPFELYGRFAMNLYDVRAKAKITPALDPDPLTVGKPFKV